MSDQVRVSVSTEDLELILDHVMRQDLEVSHADPSMRAVPVDVLKRIGSVRRIRSAMKSTIFARSSYRKRVESGWKPTVLTKVDGWVMVDGEPVRSTDGDALYVFRKRP